MTAPQEPLRLPWSLRDPAFLRRKVALSQVVTEAQKREIMATPLVADRVFTPTVACACGRVEEHEAGFPPTNFDGVAHVARHCRWCDASWLEAMP